MKSYVMILGFVGLTFFCFGQSSETHDESIRIEMISAFSNKLGLNYERYNNNSSWVLNMGVTLPTESTTRYVFELFPEYRKYFREDNSMDGWYVGPHLRFRQVREDNLYLSQSYGAGVFFGYQLNIISGFVANVYLGPDYAMGNLTLHDGVYNENNQPNTVPADFKAWADVPAYQGVLINGGISLGITF